MIIEIKGLTKKFKDITALKDVTFSVNNGEVFGLLGPNGAGKTTLIRILLNILNPTFGKVKVLGKDVTSAGYNEKRKQIGSVLEMTGLSYYLTGYENMEFFDRVYNPNATIRERKERIKNLLTFVGLWDERDRKVSEYSNGMKRKLAMARALINDPQLIILDEPTLGLDPETRRLIRDMILELKKEGKTVFMSSHDLDEVQRICSRIAILNKGEVMACDSYENLNLRFGSSFTVIKVGEVGEWINDLKNITEDIEINKGQRELTVKCGDPSIVLKFLMGKNVKILEMKKVGNLENIYLKMIESEPTRRIELINLMKKGKKMKGASK